MVPAVNPPQPHVVLPDMSTTRLRGARPAAAVAVPLLLLAACGGGSGYGGGSSGGSSSSSSTSGASELTTRTGSQGTYLTDGSGRTVYLFEADHGSASTCSGSCASVWPPLTTSGTPATSGAAKAGDLGTSKRSDGSTQITYRGHPLYYYAGDSKAGDTTGQGSTGFGASWWMVSPDGSAITGGGSSPSQGSGYRGGY